MGKRGKRIIRPTPKGIIKPLRVPKKEGPIPEFKAPILTLIIGVNPSGMPPTQLRNS